MKKLFIILALSLLACNKNDDAVIIQEEAIDYTTIRGTWELIESFVGGEGDNPEPHWGTQNFTYSIVFGTDNSVESNQFPCTGTYNSSTGNPIISFDCVESYYDVVFDNNNIILIPNPNCDELCNDKFEKISNY